jgi:hypothetical protein
VMIMGIGVVGVLVEHDREHRHTGHAPQQ